MIRINLLPVHKSGRVVEVQQHLLAFLAILSLTAVACIGWWKWKSNELDERKALVKAKQQEMQQLDKIIGEVNEFTTRKQELEEKLAVIQDLKKSKTGPVRALDDLATEIPNRVWLTEMKESGGSVEFEGMAIDHEDVSAFMKALQKSKYFTGVTLNYSKEEEKKKHNVYEFKITCSVNYAA